MALGKFFAIDPVSVQRVATLARKVLGEREARFKKKQASQGDFFRRGGMGCGIESIGQRLEHLEMERIDGFRGMAPGEQKEREERE